jgi:hypothetical protein
LNTMNASPMEKEQMEEVVVGAVMVGVEVEE